ncbi:MAG: hypothetical protein JWO72_1015 [Caulobacteraceae bacterium]|jgi:hypothetical protein|nr:hypothetical protein [Caulobacteraceae bacterium]
MPPNPSADRPKNPEVETEDQRAGRPPRPATEPPGTEDSTRSPKTATDPGSGEARKGR